MATHFSILAWEIPWTEEPCGLQSMGSQRVGHNLATKQQIGCYTFSKKMADMYMWALLVAQMVKNLHISSVQSLSHVRLFPTLWTAAHQASLSITTCRNLPKIMSIESVMPSNHPILGRPLFLLPSIFFSIRVFSNESVLCIRWPKYWSFSFNISPSNEHSGLISFRMDWLDLLAVQGTLKSLLQHHRSKASNLWCSAFFTVQLSHPYMTTGKTIALTRWTFVGKVISLLCNMLSRLVITFLPRSKRLLISCAHSHTGPFLEASSGVGILIFLCTLFLDCWTSRGDFSGKQILS